MSMHVFYSTTLLLWHKASSISNICKSNLEDHINNANDLQTSHRHRFTQLTRWSAVWAGAASSTQQLNVRDQICTKPTSHLSFTVTTWAVQSVTTKDSSQPNKVTIVPLNSLTRHVVHTHTESGVRYTQRICFHGNLQQMNHWVFRLTRDVTSAD